MQILFVSHKYPPSIGGMQKQSYELITGMEKFARVHRLIIHRQQSRLAFLITLEKRIKQILKKHPGISIIHFNDALIATACLQHTSYKHIRRVVTVHGLDVVFPSRIYQNFIFPRFNSFDLLIAVSEATAGECIKRGIDPRKVVHVNNGVDTALSDHGPGDELKKKMGEKWNIDLNKKKVFVSLGRPVKRKGYSWFLENVIPGLTGDFVFLMAGPFDFKRSLTENIWSALPKGLRTVPELILGYPSDQNAIRVLLENPEINAKAKHLGRLEQAELNQLLQLSDAFIMPNIPVKGDMEGFGLVCLEASLAGSWVFASALEGITSAVHETKNGTLVPAANKEQWINTLNMFIEDSRSFPPSDQAAAYTSENFSWQKMVRLYYEQFLILLETRQQS